MRVVIVSDFGSVNGGAAKVAIESARGLADAGVDVVFACAIGPISERLDHPRIAVERFAGEEVWKVGGRLAAARQGIWSHPAHAFLSTLFGRQPRTGTVIHLHQWTKAFSPAAIAAAGESGLPVAVTLHDYFSFCPTGGYFDFKANAPCRLMPMSGSCVAARCDRASYVHKLVRVARQWRSNEALRALRLPMFVHVSAFSRRIAEPFLPRSGRPVVVENMVDAAKPSLPTLAVDGAAVFVGRLTQEKGVLLLAQAARAADVRLRFVGNGDEAIRRALAIANPDAVVTGWLDGPSVAAELAAARCLVAPSLWYETGPLTVYEAMAAGVPPIVSRHTGAAERVRPGVDGLVLSGADVDALAGALAQMKAPDTAERLGRAAYENYWADPLTTERHVTRLAAAYRSLLSSPELSAVA